MLPAQPLDEQLRRRNQELGGEGVFLAPMMCAKRTYLFASRQPRSWQESVATVPMRPEAEGEGEGEGLLVLLHTEEEALCRCWC